MLGVLLGDDLGPVFWGWIASGAAVVVAAVELEYGAAFRVITIHLDKLLLCNLDASLAPMTTSRSVDVNTVPLLHVLQPCDLFDRMVVTRIEGLFILGLRRVQSGVGTVQLGFAFIACSDVGKEIGRGSSCFATLWTHKRFCHLVKILDVEGMIVVQSNKQGGGVPRFGLVEQSEEASVIHIVSCDVDLEEVF